MSDTSPSGAPADQPGHRTTGGPGPADQPGNPGPADQPANLGPELPGDPGPELPGDPGPADQPGHPGPAGWAGHRVGGKLRPGRHRRPRDRAGRALAGAGVLLVLVACGAGANAATSGSDDPPLAASATETAPAPGPVATRNPKADGSWGPVSNQSPVAAPTDRVADGVTPTGIRIPAIGVNAASLVPLAIIAKTGELEAPKEFTQTGWYAAGPVPGEPGPAVIAAHVDSAKDGPAVFFRLKELKAGDKVYVPRSDGVTATFTVTGVERYPKNAFPTQKVHGPTPDRALRLITCGGSFDQAKRSYRDNIVVYAVES